MKDIKDITKWGKDHWSLLVYVETCCVDTIGRLDRIRLSCNEERHPLLKGEMNPKWDPKYCTRMKEGVIDGHDDWDCLEELEEVGFIEIMSMINGYVKITIQGKKIAAQLRSHKADGGNFANFVPIKN